jgi:membrane-associated protein
MKELIGLLLGRQLRPEEGAPLKVLVTGLAAGLGPWFYPLLFLVVFCETGLVVTPFLPGDSLLFLVGALAASPASGLNLALLHVVLIGAAVLGDAVNYAIGYRVGPRVFKYEHSRLFNRKHLDRAQEFYEKYGNKTIILARFVPVVRTFAPFVAGIGKMEYHRFFLYNVVGAVAWVLLCLWSGYWFGGIPWVEDHFEAVVVAIILISVLPMVVDYVQARRRAAVPADPTRAPGGAEPVGALAGPVESDKVMGRG